MTPVLLKTNKITTSDGASAKSIITTKRWRIFIHQTELFDAALLSYGWELTWLPHKRVCKAKYNIYDELICKTGRFITPHDNGIVNINVDMLSMACKDVRKEPTLSTIPNSNDELQADRVHSFWQIGKIICWCKHVLSLPSKLPKPIANNSEKNTGNP